MYAYTYVYVCVFVKLKHGNNVYDDVDEDCNGDYQSFGCQAMLKEIFFFKESLKLTPLF